MCLLCIICLSVYLLPAYHAPIIISMCHSAYLSAHSPSIILSSKLILHPRCLSYHFCLHTTLSCLSILSSPHTFVTITPLTFTLSFSTISFRTFLSLFFPLVFNFFHLFFLSLHSSPSLPFFSPLFPYLLTFLLPTFLSRSPFQYNLFPTTHTNFSTTSQPVPTDSGLTLESLDITNGVEKKRSHLLFLYLIRKFNTKKLTITSF